MAKKGGKGSRTISRSAKTGRFVKESYAKKHPATTVKEKVITGASKREGTTGTGPGKTGKK